MKHHIATILAVLLLIPILAGTAIVLALWLPRKILNTASRTTLRAMQALQRQQNKLDARVNK